MRVVLVALAVVGLALAGCSAGGDDDEPAAAATPQSTSPSAGPSPASPTTDETPAEPVDCELDPAAEGRATLVTFSWETLYGSHRTQRDTPDQYDDLDGYIDDLAAALPPGCEETSEWIVFLGTWMAAHGAATSSGEVSDLTIENVNDSLSTWADSVDLD